MPIGYNSPRPIAGFATAFSRAIVGVEPGGGDSHEPGVHMQCVVFVMPGELRFALGGAVHALGPGGDAELDT